MKVLQRKKQIRILLTLFLVYIMLNGATLSAKAAATEVTIYGLSSTYSEKISIPEGMAQSYQIPVSGSGVTYSVSSGSSAKVSSTGLVKPKYTYWKRYTGYSMSVAEGEEYDYYTMNSGDTTIVAKTGTTSYTYTIHVEDYASIYCNQVMDDYLAANITEGLSDEAILDVVTRFPASYDYNASYSSAYGMIINGGGDCWASCDAIIQLCDKLGIEAWVRKANKDPGAGSGHRNVIAKMNGKYYQLEAGYSMSKVNGYRPYNVTIRSSLFSYTVSDGTATIYQYDGEDTSGSFVISETINGYKVTGLSTSALAGCDFTAVTLPSTLTSIGDFAFSACKNLKSIQIPSSVTYIGLSAFADCTSLTAISIDSANTKYKVENQVIYSKDGTTLVMCPVAGKVTIPDTVTTIGAYAFYYNPNIVSLTIPESVTTIQEAGISTCSKLETITIKGKGLKTIGTHGFRANIALKTITLPASVTNLGAYTFAECSKLKKIYFKGDAPVFGETINNVYYDNVFFCCNAKAFYPDGNTTWTEDVMKNHGGTITWAPVSEDVPEESDSGETGDGDDDSTATTQTYYNEETGVKISVAEGKKTATLVSIDKAKANGKVVIPNTMKVDGTTYTITAIGRNAFKGNKKVTSIKLGSRVKTIGGNAFYGCTKLKSVTIGKNVTTIGDKAFYKCKALTRITIPSKVNSIGKQAFAGCSKLKSITIKTSKLTTKNVGKNAFKGIPSRATIKVPKKKVKAYKILLRKKGVGKKVKIRK